jgi:hypothetical protein
MKTAIRELTAVLAVTCVIVSAAIADSATITVAPKTGAAGAAAPSTSATQAAPKIPAVGAQFIPCPPSLATTGGQSSAAGGVANVGQRPALATTGAPGPSTQNLATVASAVSLRARSLTTLVAFKPGLVLSKPVAIALRYSSPAAQYQTAPQRYDCNGNRFLYNDPISGPVNSPGYAVWGKPRLLQIFVTLSEDGAAPYTFELAPNLDPLFDVAISPMRFTMTSDCDRIGDSEIHFLWYPPDSPKQLRERGFSTSKGRLVTINEFAWSRQEASASANLVFPTQAFYDKDPNIFSPTQYSVPQPDAKLLPGAGGYVGRHLRDSSGQGGCEADTAFDMSIKLRQYPNL